MTVLGPHYAAAFTRTARPRWRGASNRSCPRAEGSFEIVSLRAAGGMGRSTGRGIRDSIATSSVGDADLSLPLESGSSFDTAAGIG